MDWREGRERNQSKGNKYGLERRKEICIIGKESTRDWRKGREKKHCLEKEGNNNIGGQESTRDWREERKYCLERRKVCR